MATTTLTQHLARRMAAAKKAQTEAVRELAWLGREAERRHDRAAKHLETATAKAEAEPGNEKRAADRDAWQHAQAGLYAGSQFAKSLVEAQTGQPPAEPDYHEARDEGGKFAKKFSAGHMFRRLLGKQ